MEKEKREVWAHSPQRIVSRERDTDKLEINNNVDKEKVGGVIDSKVSVYIETGRRSSSVVAKGMGAQSRSHEISNPTLGTVLLTCGTAEGLIHSLPIKPAMCTGREGGGVGVPGQGPAL